MFYVSLDIVMSGINNNKEGVMSEEEEDAYRKMEEEIKKEEVDDIILTKPLSWLIFAAKPNNSDYMAGADEANSSTVTGVVKKKGGVAFSIEYKSSVPKLPPINLSRTLVPLAEDYEKWKDERDKLLVKKNEKAKSAGITSSARGYRLLEDQGQPDPELPCRDVDPSRD